MSALEYENVQPQPTIFVVDDDPGVGHALDSVGQLLDLPVSAFPSAREFLSNYDTARPGCLVLDVKMPDMTGLELQRKLLEKEPSPPVIMVGSQPNVRIAVEVMRHGAVTLLEKPVRLDELTSHVRQAIRLDSERRASHNKQTRINSRLARLTSKEREVFDLVADGKTNREIAESLGLSIRAVEDRRSRLMRKLDARNVVDLVQWRAS